MSSGNWIEVIKGFEIPSWSINFQVAAKAMIKSSPAVINLKLAFFRNTLNRDYLLFIVKKSCF